MKPESGRSTGGGVILSITAAIIQAEFIVRVSVSCSYIINHQNCPPGVELNFQKTCLKTD